MPSQKNEDPQLSYGLFHFGLEITFQQAFALNCNLECLLELWDHFKGITLAPSASRLYHFIAIRDFFTNITPPQPKRQVTSFSSIQYLLKKRIHCPLLNIQPSTFSKPALLFLDKSPPPCTIIKYRKRALSINSHISSIPVMILLQRP